MRPLNTVPPDKALQPTAETLAVRQTPNSSIDLLESSEGDDRGGTQ